MGTKGFRRAKAEQVALKIGVYGPAGSGKTFTSLLIAEGLAAREEKRIAYVDTERGTDFYSLEVKDRGVHPEAFDFDALYTRSLTETIAAVRGLDPEAYSVVVIDSVTHLWEAAIDAYGGRTTSAGTIPFHAWGKIKKPYKDLMTYLLNSPMHVFLCGRQKNEYGEDDSGDLKMVGVTMKAEGETPYEPHVLIQMQRNRVKTGAAPVTAWIEKDRSGVLAGKTIILPPNQKPGHTFDQIGAPLLAVLSGSEQGKIQTKDESAGQDAETLDEQAIEKEVKSAELRDFYVGRLMSAGSPEEVLEISKAVSDDKKTMLTAHVKEVREAWKTADKKFGHA